MCVHLFPVFVPANIKIVVYVLCSCLNHILKTISVTFLIVYTLIVKIMHVSLQ